MVNEYRWSFDGGLALESCAEGPGGTNLRADPCIEHRQILLPGTCLPTFNAESITLSSLLEAYSQS